MRHNDWKLILRFGSVAIVAALWGACAGLQSRQPHAMPPAIFAPAADLPPRLTPLQRALREPWTPADALDSEDAASGQGMRGKP